MIRLIQPEKDAPAIKRIYAPFVTDTAVTFEYTVPSDAEFYNRIQQTAARFPWLVWETSTGIHGYAYASAHGERQAFQWAADLSIYIEPQHQREGNGRRLYQALYGILAAQGYYSVYAAVSHPNPASSLFHTHEGFTETARFPAAGFKFNRWYDLIWYEKQLVSYRNEKPNPAAPPVPVTALSAAEIARCIAGADPAPPEYPPPAF